MTIGTLETPEDFEREVTIAKAEIHASGTRNDDEQFIENRMRLACEMGAAQTTKLLDEERRRWYAAFPECDLEGLAPEVAARHIRAALAKAATAKLGDKPCDDCGALGTHEAGCVGELVRYLNKQ